MRWMIWQCWPAMLWAGMVSYFLQFVVGQRAQLRFWRWLGAGRAKG